MEVTNNQDDLILLLRDKQVLYQPNPGNGGDALIVSGTFSFFEYNRIPFQIFNPDLHKKHLQDKRYCLVYAGGGNLVDVYSDARDFIRKHHSIAENLVLLPHTINGNQQLLSELSHNTHLFCREKVSYEYTRRKSKNATVYLREDMAFQINPTETIKDYGSKYPFRIYTRYLASALKRGHNPLVLNAFRTDVEKTSLPLPAVNMDVSIVFNYNRKMDDIEWAHKNTADILRFISCFRQINTNRLHIAIAGALIGRKVDFYPNSYYKNKAVYDLSLKQSSNIKFRG